VFVCRKDLGGDSMKALAWPASLRRISQASTAPFKGAPAAPPQEHTTASSVPFRKCLTRSQTVSGFPV
jgi:hypothetical protein